MRPYRAIPVIPIDGKDFVYGWYAKVEGKHYIIPINATYHRYSFVPDSVIKGVIEVIPETVGQSTSRKDKNGTDIYDGDIFKFVGGLDKGDFGFMGYNQVYYNKHTACWGWIAWNKSITPFYTYCVHGSTDGGGVVCGGMMKTKEKIEIIGNIHQNPKLMEKL